MGFEKLLCVRYIGFMDDTDYVLYIHKKKMYEIHLYLLLINK